MMGTKLDKMEQKITKMEKTMETKFNELRKDTKILDRNEILN